MTAVRFEADRAFAIILSARLKGIGLAIDTTDHFATVPTRANQMITSMRRFGWASFFAGLVLSWATTGHAQEKTPFPSLGDKRVYVSGVPDQYQGLASQIKQLERSSPQTYYVVVVKGTGHGKDATIDYAAELFKHWRCAGRRQLAQL